MTPEEETFFKLQEPAPIINVFYSKVWHDANGEVHRENDLPAYITRRGSKFWYKHGERHRDNGPAVIYHYGKEEYWENGIFIK